MAADKVRESDLDRKLRMVEQLCLYSNQAQDELGSSFGGRAAGTFERLSQNHIENMVHTVHAECVQNRTRMTVVTSGGDYRMKKRAKDLDKFSEGQAYEDGQEQVGNDAKLDALIWGTGVEKTLIDAATNRVRGERVIAWDIGADKDDARYGKPRTIYQWYVVDRAVLKTCYPDKAEDIDRARRGNIDDYPYFVDVASDLIVVTESWHLPSRPADPRKEKDEGSGDGRHAIVVQGATLFDEPWKKGTFPFTFLYWIKPRIGMWGKGMVEQLLGQQTELNRVLRHIQLSMKRAGNLKVFLDANSGVLKTHLNDRVGTIVTYNGGSGAKPEYVVHDVVSPQVIDHARWIASSMYNVEGVNAMSAQGLLPQGMDKASGRAIRMADSVSSRRRLPFLRDCETFDREVAESKIDLAKEAEEKFGNYAVAYHGKRQIDLIDLKDINLSRDQWWLRVYPTSALPPEPSARIATLDEWLNAQLISKSDYKRLADFPDLEDASTLETAMYELGEEMIDLMLNDGESVVVEPLQDKQLLARMGVQRYSRAKVQGLVDPKAAYPEEHMELLRQFITDCLTPEPTAAPSPDAAGAAPPPPPGAPPPPGPEAPPGAAPTGENGPQPPAPGGPTPAPTAPGTPPGGPPS